MADPARRSGGALLRHRGDLLGIAWILVFALLFLSPALKDGGQFAPADLGVGNSPITVGALALSTHCVAPIGQAAPVPSCPHDGYNGDEITQSIPWSTTNWKLVHSGHFPLWNDLEGNGLPQFLNFESATLALPSLVSYLFPLAEAFLVTVLIKLVIAGFGTYALCRLLGCRPLAAALGGTTFMLSGSFAGWLGWSLSGTLCFAGALCAAALWSYRRRDRTLPVVLLALCTAFSIFGGFVEAYALLGGFLLVLGLAGVVAARRRIVLGGLLRIGVGAACGLAIGAPLWLCGESILSASVRSGEVTARGLAISGTALLVAQGYDGLPSAGSVFFGAGLPDYFEGVAYVGVLGLVLAGTALIALRRRAAVIAFGVAGVAAFFLAYRLGPVSPVQRLVIDLGLGSVDVGRILPLLDFALAVLAALGIELLIARWRDAAVRRCLAISGGAVVLVVVILGVKALSGLPAPYLGLRQASLYWPVALLVLGAAAVLLLLGRTTPVAGRYQPGTVIGVLALVGQSAFLLFAGVGINSYASVAYPVTPAVATVQRIVGSSLVGIDDKANAACFRNASTGFYANENVGYGIDELAVHDPITPSFYPDSWPVPNVGQTPAGGCLHNPQSGVNYFAPAISSVALAKRYGVSYVLADGSVPPPSGMTKVAAAGPDTLYRVPGSSRFTIDSPDVVRTVTHPGDASYVVSVSTPARATLVARVTAVPGWKASADGKALTMHKVDGTFLAVSVPAGTRTVRFSYGLPHLVLAGILVLLGLLGLVVVGLVTARGRRGGPLLVRA